MQKTYTQQELFKIIIDKYGTDALKNKDRVDAIINDLANDDSIRLLVNNAYDSGAIDYLLQTKDCGKDIADQEMIYTKACQILIENTGVRPEKASECINWFVYAFWEIEFNPESIISKYTAKNKTTKILKANNQSVKDFEPVQAQISTQNLESAEYLNQKEILHYPKKQFLNLLFSGKSLVLSTVVVIILISFLFYHKELPVNNNNNILNLKQNNQNKELPANYNDDILKMQQADQKILEERIASQGDNQNKSLEQRQTDTANEILSDMIICKASSFIMGSPNSELGHESGENQHKVTLTKDFYISKYPITRLQYWTIIGNIDEISLLEKNAPITSQTVENYKKIITRLNELTLQTRPKGYSFSLPTEAQWEYACRAGTSSTLYNGKNLSDNNLSDIAWYSGNTQNYQKRIGLKQPNFWGLYDMLGNVWEVCNDFYDDLPTQDCTDPQGPAKGDNIVCRGGSFSDSMEKCRSASRHFIHYYRSAYNIGFRVALIKE